MIWWKNSGLIGGRRIRATPVTHSYSPEEPQAGVPEAVVSFSGSSRHSKASGSWVFPFSWSAFNWFLTEVRFILVTEMKSFGFLICRSLDLSPPSLWLSQLCGFCNWWILAQCFFLRGKHYFSRVNVARNNKAVLGGVWYVGIARFHQYACACMHRVQQEMFILSFASSMSAACLLTTGLRVAALQCTVGIFKCVCV